MASPVFSRRGQVVMRFLFVLLTVAVCAAAAPSAAAEPAATDSAVGSEELEGLAQAIEDEGARKELLSRIRALIAVRQGAGTEAPPDSTGAGFIAALSENLKETTRQLVAAADALRDVPNLFAWVRAQLADPDSRDRWMALLAKLALIVAGGLVGEWLARALLARPRRAVEEREADSLVVRLPLLGLRTVLDVAPIAVFGAVAYALVPVSQPGPQAHVVALTVINAYLILRVILAVARMVLVPAADSLRVVPLADVTANYLFIWTRRLAGIGVIGYFLAEAALLLGLPTGGHAGLLRLLGLVLTGLGVVFILQNRGAVSAWITGGGARTGRLRARLADIWHVLAIIYVIGVFAVWGLGIEGGFAFMARATVISLVILGVAWGVLAGLRRATDRGFAVRRELKQRFPTLEGRANRYVPYFHRLFRWLVMLVAGLALLEAWGVDAFGWLDTPFGSRLTQSALSIAMVVVVALLAWEAVNSGVERYLTQTDRDGKVVERSARIRTLLPLLRKVVFTVLAVMVSLIVLSELGIDIGPLLAGAGVVGLAVGFGAQTLVKDIITGLFILLEDTIAVGDYIEVGGHAGTVESLSIRTIRLRDPAGSVHTVPFSDVGTVLNYTKDFANVVLNIGIAYRENVDEVMKVIEDLGSEMAEDETLAPDIIKPLEVQGLQSLDDSAVVIRARIRVKPGKQWGMKREFNRRMKNRFDELGIEIPFPQQAITFGEDKDGNAVAGRIVVEDKRTADPPSAQSAAQGRARIVQDKGDAADGDDGE